MKLLFDLDGTLIDSNHIWQDIDRSFLEKRGFELTDAYNAGVIYATFPLAAKFTKEYCGLTESEEDIMAEWMEAAEHAYGNTIPLKPGVREFLSRCAGAGYEMYIYTSCEEPLCLAALAHHQILRYFRDIFFVRKLNIEKSKPEGFLWVAEQMNTVPEDILFFDDSPVACPGACTAGMQVVACYDELFAQHRPELEQLCDAYLTSFEDALAEPDFVGRFAHRGDACHT